MAAVAHRGRWLGMVLAVVAGLALWTAPAPAQVPLTTTTMPPATTTTKPPRTTTTKPPVTTAKPPATTAPGTATTANPKAKTTTVKAPTTTAAPAPSTTLLNGTPDAGATPTTAAQPRVIPSGEYHPLGLLITLAGFGLAGMIFAAQWILTNPKRRAGFTL